MVLGFKVWVFDWVLGWGDRMVQLYFGILSGVHVEI